MDCVFWKGSLLNRDMEYGLPAGTPGARFSTAKLPAVSKYPRVVSSDPTCETSRTGPGIPAAGTRVIVTAQKPRSPL